MTPQLPLTRRRSRRGFALLVVMLMVALVALGAAALLDLVNIDIGIAAEHRKTVEAQTASVGGVLESIGHQDFERMLPRLDDTDPVTPLRTPLVTREGGAYVMDPEAVVARTTVDSDASPFISGVGSRSESGYQSDVSLLRVVPRQNTSHRFAVAVYEVRARASVDGGDATREARSLVYVPVAVGADQIARQRHAR